MRISDGSAKRSFELVYVTVTLAGANWCSPESCGSEMELKTPGETVSDSLVVGGREQSQSKSTSCLHVESPAHPLPCVFFLHSGEGLFSQKKMSQTYIRVNCMWQKTDDDHGLSKLRSPLLHRAWIPSYMCCHCYSECPTSASKVVAQAPAIWQGRSQRRVYLGPVRRLTG